jgi:predicted ribosomally synthesized peptide with SipW-like signal peptide
MNKKIGLVITAGALSACLIVGSTLAYFTDRKEATNTFTMGNLAVDLLENGEVQEGGLDFPDLVPGAVEDKVVTVKNTDKSVDAYVRVALGVGYAVETDRPVDLALVDLVTFTNPTDWILHNGYYYYTKVLAKGQTTSSLFEEVSVPTSWGNDMALTNFEIEIEMEAIQADNLYTPGVNGFSVSELATLWNQAIQ